MEEPVHRGLGAAPAISRAIAALGVLMRLAGHRAKSCCRSSVMPPVIAAIEPDQKSSTQVGNPSLPPSLWCTRCVCASTPPGIASRPSASSSCVPAIVPPSWAIRPSARRCQRLPGDRE